MRPITRLHTTASHTRRHAEQLETRRLFLTHTVEGTSVADAISIGISGNQILIVVNGVSDTKLDSLYDEVVINCNGGSDTVSIIATGDNAITVNGGAGNDTLNVGNGSGSLSPIDTAVTFVGGTESDTLVLHDQNRGGTASYTVSGSTVSVPTITSFNFTTTELVDINGTTGNSLLVLDGQPTANVSFEGGTEASGGQDGIVYQSSTATAVTLRPSGTTVGSHTATWGTRSITATTTERASLSDLDLTVVTPSADDSISILGSTLAVTSGGLLAVDIQVASLTGMRLDTASNDGGAGNDTLSIGSFDLAVGLVLELDVGTGNNTFNATRSLTLDTDFGTQRGSNLTVNATTGAVVTFAGAQTLKALNIANGAFVQFTGVGSLLTTKALRAGAGTANHLKLVAGQSATVTEAFEMTAEGGILLFGDSGTITFAASVVHSHVPNSQLRVNAGVVRFNSDAGGATLDRNLSVQAQNTGRFIAGVTQHLHQLSVTSGSTASVLAPAGGGIVFVLSLLSVPDAGGFLDLNDNALIVNYASSSPLSTIESRIAAGRNGGTWNGPGIRSGVATLTPGTAIGFAEATDLFGAVPPGTTWLGEPIDATSVLVRHTIEGDATLDHTVNFDDLLKLAASYNSSPTRWSNGDFTYDATTNFDDLLKLASKYNTSLPAAPAPVISGNVEPDDANGVAGVLD